MFFLLLLLALLLTLLLFYLWSRLEFNIFVSSEESIYPVQKEAQRINLFIEYYIPSNLERRKEIDFTLKYNLDNPYIDRVYTIIHSEEERKALPEGVYPILIEEERPTFGHLFRILREYTQKEDISILANSDIAFDETISLCKGMSSQEVYTLTRYEVETPSLPLQGKLRYLHGTSQDAWIFRGKPRQELETITFTPGIPRCDNRLAYLLRESGYALSNPCLSIKSYHIHSSNLRSYTPRNAFLTHPLDYSRYKITPGKGCFIPVSKITFKYP